MIFVLFLLNNSYTEIICNIENNRFSGMMFTASRVVRIEKVIESKVISESSLTTCLYFGYKLYMEL